MTDHIHCAACGAVEGEATRADFDTCPHDNPHCAVGSACGDCCVMADIARRY